MDFFSVGSEDLAIDETQTGDLLDAMLQNLGELRRVLLLPPDFTRVHSWAGTITEMLYERPRDRAHVEILPACGTHAPMTRAQIEVMFPGMPHKLFREHNWRTDLACLGRVSGDFVRQVSNGKVDFPIDCCVNRLLVEGRWDRIISIGQVVPHEVAGMANHAKNVFVGAGGQDTINKTHFLGAVCNMEAIMGHAKTPVREVLDYMSAHFARDLPLVYVLTCRGKNAEGALVTRGLYAGDDETCFAKAARLAQRVNVNVLDEPLQKAVVHLDPDEYTSTWLGNKAIYRTRMAMADGGELVVLAPGVQRFGEDPEIDGLIRKYGYCGTDRVLELVSQNDDLRANLSAAAHLIHGSTEGRFAVTYCTDKLTKDEVEGVGFHHVDIETAGRRYALQNRADGFSMSSEGERVFSIFDVGQGLWTLGSRFPGASE